MAIKKSVDVKLNVKPIYIHLIHRYEYQGPCRSGHGIALTREYDEMVAAENFKTMQAQQKEIYADQPLIHLQKPAYMPLLDEFICREEALDVVRDDVQDADVFLAEGLMGQHIAVQVAKRFKKPMGAVGCCTSTDVTACLLNAGLEAYGFIDQADAKHTMQLLRARKGMRNTRVLSVLKGDIVSKGVESNIRDMDLLTNRYGITFKFINSEDFLDAINELSAEEIAQAEQLSDDLIAGASFCYTEREYVLRSMKVYIAVKKLLDLYDCNAFTTPCFEICATRRLNEEKYTFCLAHSLLKEEGIPSVCESDYNSMMSMIVLMNLYQTAPHMGNLHPATASQIPESLKDKQNLLRMYHAVPTRYMKGRDKAPSPYGIQCFTESRWGATIRYDYDADKGAPITMLRFHPDGKRALAAKAVMMADDGHTIIGCQTAFFAQVEDVRRFFKKQCEYGHHYTWVYGDVREELREMGEIAGFTVETV